ncbi:MAG: YabP/YqfC family sporulation protein [Clostridia bacterium]
MKENNLEKIAKVLDLPSELFTKGAKIEINGNTEMILDGCKGILNYDDTNLKISTGNGTIDIIGSELYVKSFLDQNMLISGYIKALELNY